MPRRKANSWETKVFGPPRDELWTWQTCELQRSPAWRLAGIHARRLVDCLQVEHRDHAGRENGNLKAPYDQLEAHGIPRRCIHDAIDEAVWLGLIRCKRGWCRDQFLIVTNTPRRRADEKMPPAGA